jgi:hypothetical protein
METNPPGRPRATDRHEARTGPEPVRFPVVHCTASGAAYAAGRRVPGPRPPHAEDSGATAADAERERVARRVVSPMASDASRVIDSLKIAPATADTPSVDHAPLSRRPGHEGDTAAASSLDAHQQSAPSARRSSS